MAQTHSDDAPLIVSTVSGREYSIREILLFDRLTLTNATTLKSQAVSKLGGFRSGLGTIGDLGYVLTSSLVIGALEGALSAGMRQEGLRMLQEAEGSLLRSRLACHYFPPSQINNSQFALPQLWWATLDGPSGETKVYVHNGDPMLIARLEDGDHISLMWDKIETYRPSNFGTASQTPLSERL